MSRPGVVERARVAWRIFTRGLPLGFGGVSTKQARMPLVWPDFRIGTPQWRIVDLQSYIEEGFNINSLIYSTIMYKYRAIQSAPLRAYEGDPDHPGLVDPDHPLSELIRRPNPSQSWREYQGLQDVYLNISGDSFGFCFRRRSDELPEKILPLNPIRTFIIPGRRGTVKGYLYVPEGKSFDEGIPMLPQDVMHVKLPNPSDPLDGQGYGLSPFSAMARPGDVDNMITRFLQIFFERGTMLTYVLKFGTDVALDDDDIGDIRERWKEVYGGYESWDEPGIMDRGGDVKRLGMTFQEMGFEALDERNETRILGPFGVPLTLVPTRSGMQGATYNNKQEDRRMFWEDTMTAEIRLFEDEYQYFLQSEDGAFVGFDLSQVPALRQDVPELVSAFTELVAHGIPKSQAAEVVGLDIGELPDGDVVYMSYNLVPVGAATRERPRLPENGDGAGEATEDERDEAGLRVRKPSQLPSGYRKQLTDEQKTAHWKAVDRIASNWEDAFGDAARRAFERDKREILALLNELKQESLSKKQTISWQNYLLRVEDYLDTDGTENWRSVFIPLFQGVITDQGNRWATVLGMTFDAENFFARDWFNDYTLTFAQAINDTTKDTIATIIAQAQEEGWSIPTMQDRLEQTFQQFMSGNVDPEDFEWYEERMPSYRRELIARDQTLRSSNAGNHHLFREWNVPVREWLATRDDRVRDAHLAADGQIREIGEPFDVGGARMMFPGDDSLNAPLEQIIQCRCTELPVLETEEETR